MDNDMMGNGECENYSLFLDAIRNHDENAVQSLVQKGIFLKKDSANVELICPLELAISLKNLQIVRILLHHGSRISAKIRSFNETALHYAVITRQRAMVLELLRHEVDWQARDEKGASVLHMVFELGQANFHAKSNGMLQRKSSKKCVVERKVIDILEVFVALNADVNSRTNHGETALRLALREGMIEVAEYLLTHGANMNVCDNEGNSLLHLLIEDELRQQRNCEALKDNETIIDWLLMKGANVNGVNARGQSPIQLAIQHRLKGILLTLLDYIDVRYVNSRGETWLHMFLEMNCESGYSCGGTGRGRRESLSSSELDDIVEDLVEMGVPVDVADCYGSTALHVAALHKKVRIVRKMLERFDNVWACDGLGRTVLHVIADRCIDERGNYIEGYAELVRSLIAKGADFNRLSKDGVSAVQLAAKHRHLEMLWIFKEHHADLASVCTSGGETLLHLVAKRFTELKDSLAEKMTVEMLISQGCDVNARSKSGATPLHVAALYGNAQVVKSLLKHEARVDCEEDLRRSTALHLAMNERVAKILVRRGADVNATDKDGLTALHLATSKNQLALCERLIDLGADLHCRDTSKQRLAPLHMAVQQENRAMVKLLVERGADLDLTTGWSGSTGLHLALERGSVQMAQCLVELGADVNFRDERDRSSSLHTAIRAGLEQLVEFLLDNGADVNARQAFGETPLHVAIKYFQRGGPRVTRMLLKAGAHVDARSLAGRTALQYAIEYDCAEGVELLLQFGADIHDAFAQELFSKMSNNCDMACHVIEHLVKLEALELPSIHEFHRSIDKRSRQFERLRECCREEVAQLKAHKIDDRCTSLFDLLHMRPRRRFVCMNHNDFLPSHVEAKFPKYHGLIWRSYHEALERKFLLTSALDAWYLLTEIELPSICVDHVVGFLDNQSLKSMIEAAEAIELEEIC